MIEPVGRRLVALDPMRVGITPLAKLYEHNSPALIQHQIELSSHVVLAPRTAREALSCFHKTSRYFGPSSFFHTLGGWLMNGTFASFETSKPPRVSRGAPRF